MTEKKRKAIYWTLKGLSILISCGLPIIAVFEKFPVWTEKNGTGYSIGVGVVMIGIVLLTVFRRTVFNFAKDHLNLKYAPPITIWIVLLIISYALICLSNVLKDMTTVFWMGLIGCAVGTLFTYFADNHFREKVNDDA